MDTTRSSIAKSNKTRINIETWLQTWIRRRRRRNDDDDDDVFVFNYPHFGRRIHSIFLLQYHTKPTGGGRLGWTYPWSLATARDDGTAITMVPTPALHFSRSATVEIGTPPIAASSSHAACTSRGVFAAHRPNKRRARPAAAPGIGRSALGATTSQSPDWASATSMASSSAVGSSAPARLSATTKPHRALCAAFVVTVEPHTAQVSSMRRACASFPATAKETSLVHPSSLWNPHRTCSPV
eukprot:11227624-Lingulodinium_polyedra.AAC.4